MPRMTNHLRIAGRASCLVVGACVILFGLSRGIGTNLLFSAEPNGRQNLLIPYEQRVISVDEQHSQRVANMREDVPPGFQPWWDQYLDRPLWDSDHALTIDVEALVLGAMMHSPKVLALSTIPEIQKTEICAAQAAFDPAPSWKANSYAPVKPRPLFSRPAATAPPRRGTGIRTGITAAEYGGKQTWAGSSRYPRNLAWMTITPLFTSLTGLFIRKDHPGLRSHIPNLC